MHLKRSSSEIGVVERAKKERQVTLVTSRNSRGREEVGIGARSDKKVRNRLVFIDLRTRIIE